MKRKIGIIHSIYRSSIPSGENLTVQEISNYLKSSGFEVSFWSFHSDNLIGSPLKAATHALKIVVPDRKTSTKFKEWVLDQDTIQIHNNFPVLTLEDQQILKDSGKPIIRVIHNYRKTCLSGNHVRNGRPCFKCDMESTMPGVLRSCYNKSFIKSAFASAYTHKVNILERSYVHVYIAISEVISEYLIDEGIASERIITILNAVTARSQISNDASEVLFIGRLEEEKGIKLALETWEQNPSLPILNVVGSGSLETLVKSRAANMENVKFFGYLQGQDLDGVVERCKVSIFPNSWEEPFGRTMAESLSRGQAIVATDLGIARQFIVSGSSGFLTDGTNFDLAEKVNKAMDIPLREQVTVGQELWRKNFSSQSAMSNWDKFYTRFFEGQ